MLPLFANRPISKFLLSLLCLHSSSYIFFLLIIPPSTHPSSTHTFILFIPSSTYLSTSPSLLPYPPSTCVFTLTLQTSDENSLSPSISLSPISLSIMADPSAGWRKLTFLRKRKSQPKVQYEILGEYISICNTVAERCCSVLLMPKKQAFHDTIRACFDSDLGNCYCKPPQNSLPVRVFISTETSIALPSVVFKSERWTNPLRLPEWRELFGLFG